MKNNNKTKTKSIKIITRKQAIKKVGVTALTAASLLLLETKAKAADSPESVPNW